MIGVHVGKVGLTGLEAGFELGDRVGGSELELVARALLDGVEQRAPGAEDFHRRKLRHHREHIGLPPGCRSGQHEGQ